MLQQDPHGARQAAGSKEKPSLWMVVLWIRQRKYRKGRVKARNSRIDFYGEHKRFQGFAGVWWPTGAHHWPSPEICGPLGTNHTVCISCLLWGLGFPVLGYLAHPPVSPWRVWGQMLSIFGKLSLFGTCHFSSCQECKQISEKPKKRKIITAQIYFTTGSEHDQVSLEWNHLWGKCLTPGAKGSIAARTPLPAIPRCRKEQHSQCFPPGNNDRSCSCIIRYLLFTKAVALKTWALLDPVHGYLLHQIQSIIVSALYQSRRQLYLWLLVQYWIILNQLLVQLLCHYYLLNRAWFVCDKYDAIKLPFYIIKHCRCLFLRVYGYQQPIDLIKKILEINVNFIKLF